MNDRRETEWQTDRVAVWLAEVLKLGNDWEAIARHPLARLVGTEGADPADRGEALLRLLQTGLEELRDLGRRLAARGQPEVVERAVIVYLGAVWPALRGRSGGYRRIAGLLSGGDEEWTLALMDDPGLARWRPPAPLAMARRTFYRRRQAGIRDLACWLTARRRAINESEKATDRAFTDSRG